MAAKVAEYIDRLSREIGYRPATSQAERRAADYVALEMEEFADEVATEEFRGLPTFVWMYVVIFLLGALAAATFATQPSISFVMTFALFVFYNQEVNRKGMLFEMFPKRGSQNIVGVINATDTPRRRVVLVANLDTRPSGLLFRKRLRPQFRWVMTGGVFVLLTQFSMILFQFFGPRFVYPRYVILFLMVVQVLMVIGLLWHHFSRGNTPGANDNASGAAALLAVGQRLAEQRLPETEVWLVATGCGAAVQSGAMAFLKRHWAEVRGDSFITLSHVGAGALAYTLGEGGLKTYACEAELIDIMRDLSEQHPEWNLGEVVNYNEPNDALPLMGMGLRVIGLRGYDADGFGVEAALPSDTPEVIQEQTIAAAIDAAEALVRAITTEAYISKTQYGDDKPADETRDTPTR